MSDQHNTREITYIGLGIACLIAGGFAILQLSMIFPIPGVKYVLMAPYLSMVLYIIISLVNSKYAILKLSCVFAGIMTAINLFMGLAIVLTGLLTQVSSIAIGDHPNNQVYSAALFSAYTGLTALIIPKYLMGGVFAAITLPWIALSTVICCGFGLAGVYLARKIMKHIQVSRASLR